MPHRTEALERVRSERKLAALIAQADFKLGKQSLEKLPEYGIKLRLLKAMDFVSDSEVRALCMLCVLCTPATHTILWNRHSPAYSNDPCCLCGCVLRAVTLSDHPRDLVELPHPCLRKKDIHPIL